MRSHDDPDIVCRWSISSLLSHARRCGPGSIGSALKVVNLVTAEFNRDTRTLQDGDRVHQDETIEVGLDASSETQAR